MNKAKGISDWPSPQMQIVLEKLATALKRPVFKVTALRNLVMVCLAAAIIISDVYAADLATKYYTSQTLTFPGDADSSISRSVLTTPGRSYLEGVLPNLPEPNASVVKLLLDYPEHGVHDYWWPRKGEGSYDGSTTDVLINGQVVMKGETKARTFCCGLTLEVFYGYLKSHPELARRIPADQYSEFKRYWFCRELFSPGPRDAMTTYSVGTAILRAEDALPGDFVQVWRKNKSGHSVIFVNWLRDDQGNRIGLQYWSTQPATGGIGFHSELFGTLPKQIDESYVSIARPLIIN